MNRLKLRRLPSRRIKTHHTAAYRVRNRHGSRRLT